MSPARREAPLLLRPLMPEQLSPHSVHPNALLYICLVAYADALLGVFVQISRGAEIGVLGNLVTVVALTIGFARFRKHGSTADLAAWLFPAVVVTLTLVDAVAWGGFGPTAMIWPMVTIGAAVWLKPVYHRVIVATVLGIITIEAALLYLEVLRPDEVVTTPWISVSWLEATVITSASAVMGTWVYRALQAENAATSQKSLAYETAVGGLGVGLWEYDLTTRTSQVTQEVAERMGTRAGELSTAEARALLDDRLSPDDAARMERAVREVARHGKPREMELQLRGAFPAVWFHVQLTRGADEHGNPTLRAAVQDISERRRRDEHRTAFLAMMSHELRTPLNGLLGSAELLGRVPMDAANRRYLDTILRTGEHIRGIFDDILDLTRIESGAMELIWQDVDPRALVYGAAELFGVNAARKGVDLSIYVEPSVPETIHTDAVRARQIIVNLVSNALKFTRAGEVRVRATRDGDDVVVSVADTGVGIPPELLPRIFDAYERGVYAGGGGPTGQGLGLAIVRRVVEQLGATITCDSTVGQGTRFCVRFPAGNAPPPAGHQLDGCTIAVVGFAGGTSDVIAHSLQAAGATPVHMDTIDDVSSSGASLAIVSDLPADHDPTTSGPRFVIVRPADQPVRHDTTAASESRVCAIAMPVEQSALITVCARALRGETPSGAQRVATPHAEPLAALRILVVDDEPVNLEITARTLEYEGAIVSEATDAETALRYAEHQRYDVILMDLNLPGLSGTVAISCLRELPSSADTRILAFTADVTVAARERALSAGADDILVKPASAARLVEACLAGAPRER